MNHNLNDMRKGAVRLSTILGLILFVAGCQTVPVGGQERRVKTGYGVALQEGTHQADRYQAPDLDVVYEYTRRGDTVQLQGTVTFADRIKMNFSVIQDFSLGVLLADEDRNILANYGLTGASSFDSGDSLPFHGLLQLPPGTTTLVFTYRGRATEGPSAGRGLLGQSLDVVETSFWEYPVEK